MDSVFSNEPLSLLSLPRQSRIHRRFALLVAKTIDPDIVKPQSHRAYDQVTTYLRPKNVGIVGKSLKGRVTGRRGRG